jgi:hypothetical protein
MQQEMSVACDVDTKAGNLLLEMDWVYDVSQDLLCGKKCPCNLAMTNSTNLTLSVPNGAFNVFKCPNSPVKSDSDFSEIFTEVETTSQCSGICKMSPYFIYSNVNNGVPTQRCYEQIKRNYQETLLLWIASCLAVVLITAITQGVFYILLVYQLYRRYKERQANSDKYKEG